MGGLSAHYLLITGVKFRFNAYHAVAVLQVADVISRRISYLNLVMLEYMIQMI